MLFGLHFSPVLFENVSYGKYPRLANVRLEKIHLKRRHLDPIEYLNTVVLVIDNTNPNWSCISYGLIARTGKFFSFGSTVCTSSVRNDSMDYPLLVPNGTYTYTANNCVKCQCNAANNWILECEPARITLPGNRQTCPSTQCAGTSFDLGNTSSNSNCNLSRCAYAGYRNSTIFTTLTQESTCPAGSGNNNSSPSGNGSAALRWSFLLLVSLVSLHLLSW